MLRCLSLIGHVWTGTVLIHTRFPFLVKLTRSILRQYAIPSYGVFVDFLLMTHHCRSVFLLPLYCPIHPPILISSAPISCLSFLVLSHSSSWSVSSLMITRHVAVRILSSAGHQCSFHPCSFLFIFFMLVYVAECL